jgi:hypothetical protein
MSLFFLAVITVLMLAGKYLLDRFEGNTLAQNRIKSFIISCIVLVFGVFTLVNYVVP